MHRTGTAWSRRRSLRHDGASLSLSFTAVDAPSLLFQAPFRYETPAASRGTDVLQIVSAEVVAGQLTLYAYASYYP